jgi:type II secretory pathway component PulF
MMESSCSTGGSRPLSDVIVALAITAALSIWVVPTFKQVFDGFGARLPAPTQIVMALSGSRHAEACPRSHAQW